MLAHEGEKESDVENIKELTAGKLVVEFVKDKMTMTFTSK
jgi:hypothetical protein